MGLVKSNVALFMTMMNSKDTLNEYSQVFKAQVNTIKVQGDIRSSFTLLKH